MSTLYYRDNIYHKMSVDFFYLINMSMKFNQKDKKSKSLLFLFSFINRQINRDKRSHNQHSIEHRQKKIIHIDNYKYIFTQKKKRKREKTNICNCPKDEEVSFFVIHRLLVLYTIHFFHVHSIYDEMLVALVEGKMIRLMNLNQYAHLLCTMLLLFGKVMIQHYTLMTNLAESVIPYLKNEYLDNKEYYNHSYK